MQTASCLCMRLYMLWPPPSRIAEPAGVEKSRLRAALGRRTFIKKPHSMPPTGGKTLVYIAIGWWPTCDLRGAFDNSGKMLNKMLDAFVVLIRIEKCLVEHRLFCEVGTTNDFRELATSGTVLGCRGFVGFAKWGSRCVSVGVSFHLFFVSGELLC
jgi:hypothetical protein